MEIVGFIVVLLALGGFAIYQATKSDETEYGGGGSSGSGPSGPDIPKR